MNPFEQVDDEFEATIAAGPVRSPAIVNLPDALGHYLVMIAGSEPGKYVEIGANPITIGRDQKQTLVINDTELSRLHARVSLANGEVIVEDLKSTNGTFLAGARISEPVTLREGQVLQMGSQVFAYERHHRREIDRAEGLARDIRRASSYVRSLLPEPVSTGHVHVDWRFIPSAQLGGDAFGYSWLDPNRFVFYLLDVSGHGAGSAMHSVSVMNVLRQRALPKVDFGNPGEVLTSLNDRFQMASHNGLYFTMWYGVLHVNDRSLSYSSAGHHPAYLVPQDRQVTQPLGLSALMIGAFPDTAYTVQQVIVPANSALYLFSDGVFDIQTIDERQWSLTDFLPLITQPVISGTSEPDRLHRAVTQAAAQGLFADDFSLMVVTFP